MYDFIKNMWIMKEFTMVNVANSVTKGYITQEQANEILAMPQVA
jgi:hypothetical protein